MITIEVPPEGFYLQCAPLAITNEVSWLDRSFFIKSQSPKPALRGSMWDIWDSHAPFVCRRKACESGPESSLFFPLVYIHAASSGQVTAMFSWMKTENCNMSLVGNKQGPCASKGTRKPGQPSLTPPIPHGAPWSAVLVGTDTGPVRLFKPRGACWWRRQWKGRKSRNKLSSLHSDQQKWKRSLGREVCT